MPPAFWRLQTASYRGLGESAPDMDWETIRCPADEGHIHVGKRITDLSVILNPSGVKDFTWTWGSNILVSQRVVDLFKTHHVTGFEVRPAKTAYREDIKEKPPRLFELVVTGWGGFAAGQAGVTFESWCPACDSKEYVIKEPSRLIDPAAWDGSDLFIVWPLPRYRFASDRLAAILRRERVSGVKLIPAEQIPIERGATLGPCPLDDCMPEVRARELEARFDVAHWLLPARRPRA